MGTGNGRNAWGIQEVQKPGYAGSGIEKSRYEGNYIARVQIVLVWG